MQPDNLKSMKETILALWNKSTAMAPLLLGGLFVISNEVSAADDRAAVRQEAEQWRAEHRIIDLHQHLDYQPELLERAIRVMDASGVGLGTDLTPGTVTSGPDGQPSEFEAHKKMEDSLFPGRWVQYMNLDYKDWDQPNFAQEAVRQVEKGYKLAAAGFKEWKRFGLFLRDGQGKLIHVDDPRLDPMWERLGQLNIPVSIHVADPKAFFEPYNNRNERWQELKDHKSWWFGDANVYPGWKDLLEALNRVVGRHPHTTFVCVHFANNAEELDWVADSLTCHPNMNVDLAARIPELGRHDPGKVHDMFVKFQDRILFGTEFQSLQSKMILGSSGNEPPPTDADAEVFFRKEYRWLETWDRDWAHMTPIRVARKQTGENYQVVNGPVIHGQPPDATLLIGVMCNYAAPISQKLGIGQFREVPQRRSQRVAGFRIPHSRCIISAGSDNPVAIGTKGCRSDLFPGFNWGNEPPPCVRIPYD